MQIPPGKKIYFSSDNHLGAPTAAESLPREQKFVRWLDTVKKDAAAIFLLGDLFDFYTAATTPERDPRSDRHTCRHIARHHTTGRGNDAAARAV